MQNDISSPADWRKYESNSWREAVRNRGLRLRSLDPDERQLVFDAISADLEYRKRTIDERAHLRSA